MAALYPGYYKKPQTKKIDAQKIVKVLKIAALVVFAIAALSFATATDLEASEVMHITF